MKKILRIVFFLFSAVIVSQEKQELSVLNNNKNWAREIIKFPIDWAPNLKVSGFEELLFSPNWKDSKNEEFWSLVIAWNISSESPFNQSEIANYLESYFDGLMKPNHWETKFPEPKIHLIKNSKKTLNDSFIGKMTFFDGFHTGKLITVNIIIEQYSSIEKEKTILLFRLSPKKYEHKIWKVLNEIKLKKDL